MTEYDLTYTTHGALAGTEHAITSAAQTYAAAIQISKSAADQMPGSKQTAHQLTRAAIQTARAGITAIRSAVDNAERLVEDAERYAQGDYRERSAIARQERDNDPSAYPYTFMDGEIDPQTDNDPARPARRPYNLDDPHDIAEYTAALAAAATNASIRAANIEGATINTPDVNDDAARAIETAARDAHDAARNATILARILLQHWYALPADIRAEKIRHIESHASRAYDELLRASTTWNEAVS